MFGGTPPSALDYIHKNPNRRNRMHDKRIAPVGR